ncbi:uncharacterized protein LOC143471247 [Clavelina lepadiformis]|uniref:uncharacterized protein LOC143471247 n=1 Tax=Clavelina lepadiformis TaxID=159417 RepID=UPI0040410BED
MAGHCTVRLDGLSFWCRLLRSRRYRFMDKGLKNGSCNTLAGFLPKFSRKKFVHNITCIPCKMCTRSDILAVFLNAVKDTIEVLTQYNFTPFFTCSFPKRFAAHLRICGGTQFGNHCYFKLCKWREL